MLLVNAATLGDTNDDETYFMKQTHKFVIEASSIEKQSVDEVQKETIIHLTKHIHYLESKLSEHQDLSLDNEEESKNPPLN